MERVLYWGGAVAICWCATAVAGWQVVDRYGSWALMKTVDEMTDKTRCMITSSAASVDGGGWLAKTNVLVMEPDRQPDKPDKLMFSTSGILASDPLVTYRIDSNQPVELQMMSWEHASQSLHFTTTRQAPKAYELKAAKRIVLRVSMYEEAPLTVVFDLQGFAEAYDAAVACLAGG